jgi:hypothetical protein
MPRLAFRPIVLAALTVLAVAACASAQNMTFFVTSAGMGDGGNLGGLAGADAYCLKLATAAGSRGREWRAYLSAAAADGRPAIHARDRIGPGPWFNAQGFEVAGSLGDLHGTANKLGGRTSLDEHGNFVGAGAHDILTGSNADGTLADGDSTCHNWTSTQGHAMLGHSNKVGSIGGTRVRSWNSAHLSEGCTVPALQKLGSEGRLYCFAVK